jgi:SAM-dependent methyltransferase
MDDKRKTVREVYGKIGAGAEKGCCSTDCCGETSKTLGYSEEDLAAAPEGADLGLGCGNPGAIAALEPGMTVVDLGSGGGFDCFLAAKQVGGGGRVIGVDMTPEMVSRARENAAKDGSANVEFRLGEIEHLPVADGVADVILSNCVINLSAEKAQVFREAFRVLRPGGRLAIADVVAIAPIPEEIQREIDLFVGCVAGAALVADLETMLADAGFVDVRITVSPASREVIRDWIPDRGVEDYVASATIEARKP